MIKRFFFNTYILLNVLLCSIDEYFYALCEIYYPHRQIVLSVRAKLVDIFYGSLEYKQSVILVFHLRVISTLHHAVV